MNGGIFVGMGVVFARLYREVRALRTTVGLQALCPVGRIPYVSVGLWRGFVFSRLAASAAARTVNAALPNDF